MFRFFKSNKVIPVQKNVLNAFKDDTVDDFSSIMWRPEKRSNQIYNQDEITYYKKNDSDQVFNTSDKPTIPNLTSENNPKENVENKTLSKNSDLTIIEKHSTHQSGLLYKDANTSSHNNNIITAVKMGDIELTATMLAEGADVNAIGMWGNTPLIVACQYKHTDIALLLCKQKGIDVNIVNEKGNTALLFACLEGLNSIALAILRGENPIISNTPSSIYYSHIDKTIMATPLSASIISNNIELVKLLFEFTHYDSEIPFEFKIFVNRKTCLNNPTPIELASACGYPEVIEYLSTLKKQEDIS